LWNSEVLVNCESQSVSHYRSAWHSKPAQGACAIVKSEYEAVTWLCVQTKLRTSLITWLWQNESSSGTVLHVRCFVLLTLAKAEYKSAW